MLLLHVLLEHLKSISRQVPVGSLAGLGSADVGGVDWS